MSAVWEWQIAEGSMKAHVIDSTEGSKSRSGPRSVCGRYPQRNREHPWFTLLITDPGAVGSIRHYGRMPCAECLAWVERRAAS
jgi:hypothetical protein